MGMVGTLLTVAAPVASAAGAYTCTGGVIPPGSYRAITVTGICVMPAGAVNVQTDLAVAPGAVLVAGIPGSPTNVTLTVSGGLSVGSGAVLLLGCAPSFGCDYTTSDVVGGGLVASGALAVILHGVSIMGGLSILGGGGGSSCDPNPLLTALAGFPLPAYDTTEDSSVSGGVAVSGVVSCWMGFARNRVNGTVTFVDNALADPDAMEILANAINGQLACSGNTPTPTNIADGVAFEPNAVTGKGSGQCAGL